jgi:hypothetical protein
LFLCQGFDDVVERKDACHFLCGVDDYKTADLVKSHLPDGAFQRSLLCDTHGFGRHHGIYPNRLCW